MKLNKVVIKNLKSYYPAEEVVFGDGINVFVGPNGGGKSNLFELIQGVVSSIIYKHVTLSYNGDRTDPNSANYNFNYMLQIDNADPTLMRDLFEKHYTHQSESSSLELYFTIKKEDINIVEEISKSKDKIIEFAERNFQNSSQITGVLRTFAFDESFKTLIGTTGKVVLENQSINGLYNEKPELADINQRFFEILPYFNILYEISALTPGVKVLPNFKYIGPHRTVNQVQKETTIDLTQTNLDKNFAKGLNQSKDNYVGIIEASYVHIVRLYDGNKSDKILSFYKKILERYLSMSFKIINTGVIYHHEYKLSFFRLNGMPIKLSSGEKEFFSLISGIILSELKDGLVLLDEPELHQHSQWQRVMMALIKELSDKYNLQFLIITHSPQIIAPDTVGSTYRIYKENDCSKVIKPDKTSLSSSPVKDLLQIINSSNNEKVFFADKVVLVEGFSDQLIFSKSLALLRGSIKTDDVIEILPVGSKNNLLKYRKFLDTWKIDNYIVADLDFLKDLARESSSLRSNELKVKLSSASTEINRLYSLSSTKLKDVLTRSYDGSSVFELIKAKKSMPKKEFFQKFDSLTEKIISSRATSLNKKIILPDEIKVILKELRKEGIFVLENGCLENCFSRSGSIPDKIEFAIKTVKSMTTARQIKKIIKNILKTVLLD